MGSLPAGEAPPEDAAAAPAGGIRSRRRSTAAGSELAEDEAGGKLNKRPSLVSRMRWNKSESAASDAEGGEAAAGATGTPGLPDREAPPPPMFDMTVRPSPVFMSLSKRVKVEAAIYTTARPRSFSLRHRSDPAGLTVQPLDDGLYVAPRAAASPRALAVLEKRLGFSPPSKALADEAGVLLRQPDPVRHVRVRPSWLDAVNLAAEQLFEVERRRPQRWGMTAGHLVAGGGGGAPHVLQVSLGAIQFHDHPLFLRENALQCAVRTLANQLADAHERQQTQLYALKISELTATTANLREQMVARANGGASAKASEAQKLQQRLSALTVELLEARQLKDEQECAERLLARRLLRLWRALKRDREEQGFRATRARTQFQLIEPNADEEAAALEADLEDEVQERKLIHALAELAAEAAGRPADAAGQLDEDATRTEIRQRQSELRKPVQEEWMVPVYTEGAMPTPPERLPQRERMRQQAAAREVFYALLLVDGRVACQMGKATLDPHDFVVRFDSSVQLQLLARPASLALQIWQRRLGGMADRLLSDVFLAIPQTASPVMPQWQHYSFADSRPFTPLSERGSDSEAVDAALGAARGALEGVSAITRHALCGMVEVSTAWTTRPADRLQPHGSAGGHTSAQELAQAAAVLDPQQVWSMVMPEELDPNAPQDVPLLSLLSRTDRGSVAGMFRAMRNQASLQWSSTWASSDRYSLFTMRRKQPGRWAQLPNGEKAVPAKDSQIPGVMRELLRPAADFDSAIDKYDQDRVAQEKAGKVKAWIEQVRARHESAKASQKYVMDTHDYVREPLLEVEAAELNCDSLLRLFEPRRKLLPNRRARRAVPGSDETARKIEVVVQSGVDLPVRAPAGGGAAASRPKSRLFVEVRFQGQTFVTDVKTGANPIWNAILELGMKAPGGDWSQKSIMNLNDEISFGLYDRVARAERDERDSTQVTTRQECRWLGGFSLPFSTLYRNGKLEGSFPLSSMPPVLLGYEKDGESSSQALVPASALRLFITINPLLPPPKEEERERLTQRDAKMQEFAQGWIKATRKNDRYVRAFAPGADGERTFICRFVRPQNPPDDLRGSASQLLRFVSQVPFLDDAAFDGGSLDVWNTSESFLELGAGDQEEHALLLCNYLLGIGKEAYVVLGSGIPEGLTSYVLSIEGIDAVLYNACTGRSWTRETLERCPLTSVGCVFNDKNIWANVGLSAVPKELSWNFADEKHWRTFFGKGGFPPPATLQSTQRATLTYSRTTESFRSEIEREVYDALQRDVEEQRGFRPTDWNRSANAKLKELLKRFEEDAAGIKPLSAGEHDSALERIRATYRMVGLPINMPYTDRSAIIKRVRETNVFMASANKIQFALAVYVHAYPNRVCSVWVYAASLEDLRAGARE